MPSQPIARRLGLACAAGVVTALAVVSSALLPDRGDADRPSALQRAAALSERSADAVSRYLDERRRDLELLAGLPDIVHAARVAAAEARRRGLQGRPVAVLERELDASRALSKDPRLAATLAAFRGAYGFTELSFTERDGYSVLGTERTPDFVQSDEDWWQRAFADGFSETRPQMDPSGTVAVELAVRITDPTTRQPMGVIKGTLALALVAAAAPRMPTGLTLEIIDGGQRIIASADSTRLLRQMPESLPPLAPRTAVIEAARVAVTPTHGGRWWVVVRAAPGAGEFIGPSYRALVESAGAAGATVMLLVLVVLAWAERRTSRVG